MNTLSTSPLHTDTDAKLPAAAYLRYEARADGWSAGRQAAFLSHLADNGVVADAARSVGMSLSGGYALRRQARGYAFNLGWEAALIIARRIVADDLMTAAIKGEESRWVREDGITTFTRQNTKLSLTLLDRINPATTVPEVMAVATRFDLFLQLIDDGVGAEEMWDYFFDKALPRDEVPARARVRAALLLCEETEGLEEEDDEDDDLTEVKSMQFCAMDGPPLSSYGGFMADLYLKSLESERRSLWASARLKGLPKDSPQRMRIAAIDADIAAHKAKPKGAAKIEPNTEAKKSAESDNL